MSRRTKLAFAAPLALLALAAGGCRIDMHDQPKYEAYEKSSFFPNGSASRPLPAHTVARGSWHDAAEAPRLTGFGTDGKLVPAIPVPVDRALLERGQMMFNGFCAPCHDRTGNGRGMVVRRGFKQAASFHDPRLLTVADGHIFDAITRGFGQMPSYAAQIKTEDRWAIVAYVRALQLAGHAPLADLPAEDRQKAQAAGAAAPAMEPPIGNYDKTFSGSPIGGGDPAGRSPNEEPISHGSSGAANEHGDGGH